jgi:histidine phosphotransferase ChpT
MTDDTDLTALTGSRICHDLVNPLGAIGNGVELLALEGRTGPELTLVAESVASATARLRFFRVAFGAGGTAQRLGRREIEAILEGYARGTRLTLDWGIDGDPPRGRVKAALLAVLCLESALPYGGTIAVRDGPRWQAEATGRRLRLEQALWDGLSGAAPMPALGPSTVQFGLLAACDPARRPAVEIGETRIALRI